MGGLAEDRVRSAIRALVERDPRWPSKSWATTRRSTSCTLRSTDAASNCSPCTSRGGRFARHRLGGQDQHRSRACRRPGGQHRRGRAPLPAPPPVKELIDIPRMADIAHACFATRSTPSSGATRSSPSGPDADDALDALKTQVFRELLTYMLEDPAHHRAVAGPHPGVAPPRTHRRPRHQRRRRRHLHGLGQGRPASRRGNLEIW